MDDRSPGPGEIWRRQEDIRAELKDDLAQLAALVDKKLSQESYDVRHAILLERVARLEEREQKRIEQAQAEAREREQQRQSDRRLIFSALIAPLLLLIVQLWAASKGAQ